MRSGSYLEKCAVNTPKQRNGYDCGVFISMFCDFLSLGIPLTFQQEHVTKHRNHIALAILHNRSLEFGLSDLQSLDNGQMNGIEADAEDQNNAEVDGEIFFIEYTFVI